LNYIQIESIALDKLNCS